MIFMKGHIEKIKKGTKTQTRRVKRGTYQVGKDYAVQSGRGKKGIPNLRIVIDAIHREGGLFYESCGVMPIYLKILWQRVDILQMNLKNCLGK